MLIRVIREIRGPLFAQRRPIKKSSNKNFMELLLIRKYNDKGVSGTISLNGKRLCDSIEPPWRNNQRQISCIPEGRYQLTHRLSLRFGHHFLVNNVPGRSAILIHAFNHALRESRGCIAPVKKLTGPGQGTSSRNALFDLMQLIVPELLRNKPVFLTIKSEKNESASTGCKAHPQILPHTP